MKMDFYFKLTLGFFSLTLYCFSNGVHIIDVENTLRSGVFNMKANLQNEVLVGVTPKNKDIVLGKHTTTINTILNNKNVSRRHARHEEKKTILQAVMGTIIVHGDDSKYHLDDHELTEADEFYKHFEILRFTEEFAQTCFETMIRSGGSDYKVLEEIDEYLYQNLYDYSGLSHDLMLGWFKEMYEKHKNGMTSKPEHIQDEINLIITKRTFSPTEGMSSQTTTNPLIKKIISRKNKSTILSTSDNDDEIDTQGHPITEIYGNGFKETKGLTEAPNLETTIDEKAEIELNKFRKSQQLKRKIEIKNLASINPNIPISQKSNWGKKFKLKNGITIVHYPGYLELIDNPYINERYIDIKMARQNVRGIKLIINVSTDMTEEEFESALRKDGNLVA